VSKLNGRGIIYPAWLRMPRKPTGGKVGKPPFIPTNDDRKTVEIMTACGFNHAQVCNQLGPTGLSEKTLIKYFRRELDTAVDKANARMGAKAYQMGLGGSERMVQYWLNCRAGWKDTADSGQTDAKPINIQVVFTPPTQITDQTPEFIDVTPDDDG